MKAFVPKTKPALRGFLPFQILLIDCRLSLGNSSSFFYSINATDCTPVTSKRLRQRTFLQPIRSSRRTM